MRIKITLAHPVSQTVANFELRAADPGAISRVIQDRGASGLNALVELIAREKMPTWMYQYDIKDFEIIDEDAPPIQQAA